MRKTVFLLAMALVVLFSTSALGQVLQTKSETVVLTWDANTETDLAGYKLYQANVDGSYTFLQEIQAGTETATVTFNAVEGVEYGWVLTAFDLAGNESGYSNKPIRTFTWPPDAPKNLKFITNIGLFFKKLFGLFG